MRTSDHRPLELGATRVEVMLSIIIVVLLGILAAVVVPQDERSAEEVVAELEPEEAAKLLFGAAVKRAFESRSSESSSERMFESKEAAVASNLATIRQAIEMYKVQHHEQLPTDPAAQLTSETTANGDIPADGGPYGPYLRNSFPANPVNNDRAIRVVDEMPRSPVGAEGWIYCSVTGEVRANVPGDAASGVPYFAM